MKSMNNEQHNIAYIVKEFLVKSLFQRRYHPFGIDLALNKMKEMGYGNNAVQPVPCFMEEKDFAKIDWYRVIGQKSS